MFIRLLFSIKNTFCSNNFTLTDLDKLLQPRIYSFDIKEILLKLRSKYYEKNIMGTKYSIDIEKSNEFYKKKQEVIGLLINTPLVYFNFYNFMSQCKARSISVEVPSNTLIKKSVKRCNLHFYCPVCNAFLILSSYPYIKTICSKSAIEKYKYKTFLLYYKNVGLNFKGCLWNVFYLHFESLSSKFGINEYLFSVKPSFNDNWNENVSMFDAMFLCLGNYSISQEKAEEIYEYSKNVFDGWSKNLGVSLGFDFDAYEVDFFTKDMFDVISIMLYRIPIDIYFSVGISPNYYQYLYSYFFTNSEIFKKYIFLFSKKRFILQLFNEFRTERDYRFLKIK